MRKVLHFMGEEYELKSSEPAEPERISTHCVGGPLSGHMLEHNVMDMSDQHVRGNKTGKYVWKAATSRAGEAWVWHPFVPRRRK